MQWYLITEDNTLNTRFYIAFPEHPEKFGLVLSDAIEGWLSSLDDTIIYRFKGGPLHPFWGGYPF